MEVEEKLKHVFVYVIGIPSTELKPEANLKSELGLDSTEMVAVRVNIEKTFGIKISEADFNQLETLKEMANYVRGKTR